MRTKIIATIGPSSSSHQIIEQLLLAGVDVFRLNFSHGTHDDHASSITHIRELASQLKKNIAILGDLQGPKIRVGMVENGCIKLVSNQQVNIWSGTNISTASDLYISYPNLADDVKIGERILMDDGKLSAEVVGINGTRIEAKVLVGGELKNKKGVNIPDTATKLPSITAKDELDLAFALNHKLDWIALSFVRNSSDIKQLRKLIQSSHSHWKPSIIAKIEKPEALDDLESIIKVSDGIMIARGDLGIEIPFEKLPIIQKRVIQEALQHSKPSIVATQMLEGMINNTTPTRAEINDVANSVMDGADALMLSAETSAGMYPVEAVKAMVKIISETEKYPQIYHRKVKVPKGHSERQITDSIVASAVRLSKDAEVSAIITHTLSGYSAFKLASHRPFAKVFIFSHDQDLLNKLSLVWGVKGFYYEHLTSSEQALEDMRHILLKNGFLVPNDLVIQMAGFPILEKAKSNMLMLKNVTDAD